MKRSLYGSRMFIADLLAVSLWALFAWHTLDYGFVVTCYIVMRIALSFEFRHKSRWAFSGGLLFAMLFVGSIFGYPDTKVAIEPIRKMIYVAGCLSGFTEETFDAFGPYADMWQRGIIWALWAIISSWLVVVPIVCSWNFKSIMPIYAVVNHLKYGRGSMIQHLLSDKALMSYLLLAVTFTVAMFAGLYGPVGARWIIAILAPVTVYVTVLKSYRVPSVRTMPALLFGLAGVLYLNVYDTMHEWVITLLTIGGILSVAASFLALKQCKSAFASIFLLLSSTFIFPMLLLGYNPYADIMCDNVSTFGPRHRGLYMISRNENVGLRDRYGIIIPPTNQRIYFLDKDKNYVAVLKGHKSNRDDEYNVYCLKERRVVVTSHTEISDISMVDDGEFLMLNACGRPFASFMLPQGQHGKFYIDLEFEPYFSDAKTTMQEFLDYLNDDYEIDPHGDYYWEEMKESNPKAYDLLCKTLAMSGEECSPANDLTFAKAFAHIVQQDNHYKGNIDKALKDIDELIEILGCSMNQGDLNQCADLARLMESLMLSISYDGLVEHGEMFRDEYVAWHNLMEVIVRYYEHVNYLTDWYRCKPMDMELEKSEWLKLRRTFVDLEKDVFAGKSSYTCEVDTAMTIKDVEEAVAYYHCEYDPDYYHPMYNEIAPAFRAWLSARDYVAMLLPEDRAKSYREITKMLVDNHARIVKELDMSAIHPALDWDGHLYKYHRNQMY